MSEELKKTIEEGLSGVKTFVDEKVAPLATEVKALSEKVEKIEKLPAFAAPAINMLPKEYKGYKLNEMGASVRKGFESDEGLFRYNKWIVDVVRALKGDSESRLAIKELHAKTGLGEASGSIGGYLVPDEFSSAIVKLAREASFLLANATVLNMGSDQLYVPTEASLATAYWPAAEKTAPTKSDPSFGQVSLTARKLGILTNPVGNELLADSAIDISALLTEQFAYAQALELDNQALNGTGFPCSGVLTAAAGYSVVMTLANFSSISADNLSEMISKLSGADVANAKFVFHNLITHYLRILKDSQNAYIYANPGQGVPGTVWELPAIKSAKAPSTTGTSTAFVSLGNWKNFYVGKRNGSFVLDLDPYSNFGSDETVFRMMSRWALAIGRSTAFVRLVSGS